MEVLLAIALFFIFVMVMFVAAIAVAIGVTGWRLDFRNRVDISKSSPAPTSWLIAPTEAASLHRRLRDLASVTRRVGPLPDSPTPGSTDDLRLKILQQAGLLDHDLAAASRAPKRHRREIMKRIRSQVYELENLNRRVIELSKRSRGANLPPGVDPPHVALGDIAERVRLLENAESELADVERANGLLDAERLIRESQSSRGTAPPQPRPLPSTDSQPIPTMPTPPSQPAPTSAASHAPAPRPPRRPAR